MRKRVMGLVFVLAAAAATACAADISDQAPEGSVTEIEQPLSNSTAVADEYLFVGQRIVSPDCGFRLDMQSDGNLVLYDQSNVSGDIPIWAVGIHADTYMAVMQNDGNLVTYDGWYSARWSSHTAGHPNSYLSVQNDGNMVIYAPNNSPLWSTHTVGPNRARIPCPNRSITTHVDKSYDRPGGDYVHFSFPVSSIAHPTAFCANACALAQPRCAAFTVVWDFSHDPVCWLKDSVPGRISTTTGIDSGYIEK